MTTKIELADEILRHTTRKTGYGIEQSRIIVYQLAHDLAQTVKEEPQILGIDFAKDYLDEIREQARREQREKDADFLGDKAMEYGIFSRIGKALFDIANAIRNGG